jgi:hypothetical protein
MRLTLLSTSVLAAAALCSGCAHQGKPPADASARAVCRSGTAMTAAGECGGEGGIDRQATREKSQQLRETQASGAAAALKPDEVWATPASKTYYCHDRPEYGKAKEGKYMTQSEAVAKGLHPADGKRCAS